MKSWEISNKFVDTGLERYEKNNEIDPYICCVAYLRISLSSIMIHLDVYFPEAYKAISDKMLEEIIGG